jgi:hypothetical protein
MVQSLTANCRAAFFQMALAAFTASTTVEQLQLAVSASPFSENGVINTCRGMAGIVDS